MNRRTRLLIGAALLALGAGLAALALAGEDADVRYVEDLLENPASHGHGTYTLLGIPQPPLVPRTGPSGTLLEPNPEYAGETVTVTAWTQDGVLYHSTHTLRAEETGGTSAWTYRNETRRAGSPEPAAPPETASWTLPGVAFPVQAFDDGDGATPRVWALYAGVLQNPLQPKPSQFEGRLLTALPDGTPLPDGALLYQVDDGGITAGCSSKFLPPETERKYGDAA